MKEPDQDCGINISEPFAFYDHATSSLKTSQHSLFVDLTSCAVVFPKSGMMRNGKLYERPTSDVFTKDQDYLSLPTPTAREGRDWSRAEVLAKLDRGDGVAKRICSLLIPSSPTITGLNPCFAEAMMTFPIGWTDLNA